MNRSLAVAVLFLFSSACARHPNVYGGYSAREACAPACQYFSQDALALAPKEQRERLKTSRPAARNCAPYTVSGELEDNGKWTASVFSGEACQDRFGSWVILDRGTMSRNPERCRWANLSVSGASGETVSRVHAVVCPNGSSWELIPLEAKSGSCGQFVLRASAKDIFAPVCRVKGSDGVERRVLTAIK
jgi:hypothetical protein